ncbi:LPO_1073/Vpar_1526 family protein [Fluviicola sp.]|uniref:LPO_1073/Vpar_1526 family protein n=1 Tax=Fluviicola sp. TaxID=1917219 RepID=UPI0031D46E01
MINDKNLSQEGGEKSTNFQGQNITIHNGLSYSDVKEIFLDLFKENFIQLKNEAAEIAQKRATEITDKFLTVLNGKNPELIEAFKDPALQDALFTTQKEFAKSGDNDLGDLLVDILIERAQTPARNMLQLVLNESLKIVPSLTISQLDVITLNFILLRTVNLDLENFHQLSQLIQENIEPFTENLFSDIGQYNYLEFQRCGSIKTPPHSNLMKGWLKKWIRNYQGLFSKGIEREVILQQINDFDQFEHLFVPCLHNNELLQVGFLNEFDLNEALNDLKVTFDVEDKIKRFFRDFTMTTNEVKDLLVKTNPCMLKLFDILDKSAFKNFELSSVGIAIAHANFRRRTGKTLDLSLWIN